MNGVGDVAIADPGQTAGTTGVVERRTVLDNVGDPVFKLNEDVRAVVDAETIAGTEVLIDPNSHDVTER